MELADPTDWATTRVPSLSVLDSLLRCNICKDFFNNAVLTNCAHTFCSICIRRALDNDGQCPTCRAPEQKPRLRRNDAVQEATDAFKTSRPDLIKIAQPVAEPETPASPARKRKRGDVDGGVVAADAQPDKRTRRQPRRAASQKTTPAPSQDDEVVIIDDPVDDVDADFVPEPDDGLVPCPMCMKRMKEDLVFAHLDRCEDEQRQPRVDKSPPLARRGQTDKPPERLPQLNYNLMKETALRTKLRELGIPSHGSKPQMQKRHTEWTNIWNANSDSARPRPKRLLLQDLDAWERSHMRGGTVENSKFMQKDFNGSQWAKDNKDEFEDLIARARAGARARAKAAAPQSPEAAPPPQSLARAQEDEQIALQSPAETLPASDADHREPSPADMRRNSTVLSPIGAQLGSPGDSTQRALERRPMERRPSESMAPPARDLTKRPMFEMPQDFRSD